MVTFWNVALWIYEFSAILCFLLLVKLTFKLSRAIDEQLEVEVSKIQPIKTIFLCFLQNFFHILIPVWNTFVCIIFIIVNFVPDLDAHMREIVQNSIKKVGDKKDMTEEEIKEFVKKKYEKMIDNSDEE